ASLTSPSCRPVVSDGRAGTPHVLTAAPQAVPRPGELYAPREMAVLSSQVERGSDDYSRRRERMEALVAELEERTALVARGGGERALERHRARGKLTARERIDRLVDPDTAFPELSDLAAWVMYD